MKNFFLDINYFRQFFGILDISLLQKNSWSQHATDDISIFLPLTDFK